MKRIAVVAGEISSDNYGSKLIKELKKINSSCSVYAVGGEKMLAAADFCIANIVNRAVVGFTEAFREIPFLLKLKKKIIKRYFVSSSSERFDGIILMDYPGFNIRLAKAAHKYGIPVFYYITPQVWAWGSSRIKVLSRVCNKLYCVFEFEKEIFVRSGGDAEFVGHPLLDEMPPSDAGEKFAREMDILAGQKVIALLPGSRKREVETVLPVAAEALRSVDARVIIALAPSVKESDIRKFIDYGEITTQTRALLLRSDAAVISSGTSNLEAALTGTPFVSVYKVSPFSYLLARILVQVKFISIVNILAGRKIVEELLQKKLTPSNIKRQADLLLNNSSYRKEIIEGLSEVAGKLGAAGSTERVARKVAAELNL